MNSAINIGQLDKKVVVEVQQLSGTSPSGQRLFTWEHYKTVWCKIVGKGMREGEENKQRTSIAMYEMRSRYMPGVNSAMRVIDGEQVYHITGVRHEGRAQTIINLEYKDNV